MHISVPDDRNAAAVRSAGTGNLTIELHASLPVTVLDSICGSRGFQLGPHN